MYAARSAPSSAAVAAAARVLLHTLGDRHDLQSMMLPCCCVLVAVGVVIMAKIPSCEVEYGALLHDASV